MASTFTVFLLFPAIFFTLPAGNVTLNNITAINNSVNLTYSDPVGGAITFTSVVTSLVNNVRCYNNTSLRGAISYYQSYSNKIQNSLFVGNKANGAIFGYKSAMNIDKCIITNTNPPPITGGVGYGLLIQLCGNSSVSNSVITGNFLGNF